ncbi:MAG: RND family transporter [Inquilinus sp.]|nr:RND family transporter [Inquilinus sp.]
MSTAAEPVGARHDAPRPVRAVAVAVFRHRRIVLALFAAITVVMAVLAGQLRIDAGFEKQLPVKHPYMQTFLEYQEQFGGANRVLIALRATEGDIFTPAFFETLKQVTDEVFFIGGVDRAGVRSIFTPNVRFIEIVEDGFAGGNVIPADFEPTPERLDEVRENILKSGQVGRLVAEDFTAAIVSAQLLERDPRTGEKLDYLAVAGQLEEQIRDKYRSEAVDVHIIGFAKVVGDIAEGATGVLLFFAGALVLTAVLVYLYCRSVRLTVLPLVCSLVAVIWQLGLLVLFGFGIDPLSILVPFLVFAIGVSHGVQMINALKSHVCGGDSCKAAAQTCFRRLFIPGSVALATDTAGFLTILLIEIPIIQELAVTASLGVAVIILTNLFLLPVLLSYLRLDDGYRARIGKVIESRDRLWRLLARFAEIRVALPTVAIAVGLLGWGLWEGREVPIGDQQQGVPELWPDSRYNQDTLAITARFAIGVDVIQVIAEGRPDGCIDHEIVRQIDDFEWHMRNIPGVQSTLSLPAAMKIINAGWNEGNLNWRVLPRDQFVLVRAVTPVETSTGLLNADCSVMPVLVFTEDHKAETLRRVVEAHAAYLAANPSDTVQFRLATGNVGVMAATNEAVAEAQFGILLWVYGAIVVLCLLTFRSIRATLCTVLPLSLVSVLCYALMARVGIGLKVSTLPVAALGVGIGVDYGIYIFSRLKVHLDEHGLSLPEAYLMTLRETGSAVLVTGLTLAAAVSTWAWSDLKFQADMGVLLAFMFLVNMAAAILVLPALAALFGAVFPWGGKRRRDR